MIQARNLEMLHTPPLNFELAAGLTHGLVGPNGIGKTTLLRMMAGQLPSRGLRVLKQDPFDNQYVMDRAILMGIDNPLMDGWNIKKLLRLGAARWRTWNADRAEELAERFRLPSGNYSAFSRGQKSALGFLFAVASGCEIMLLDEPYLGLDVDNRAVFFEELRREHGRTIVVSTHHLNEISGHLDTVLLLGDAPLASPIDDFVEDILEVTGKPQALGQLLDELGLPVLERSPGPAADRAIIDARAGRAEEVFERDSRAGLRPAEVSLETAVRVLGGAQ